MISTEPELQRAKKYLETLFYECRSISGEGFKKTVNVMNEGLDFSLMKVQSGTEVFDWRVPAEWNIKDAWVKNKFGEKIIDFKASNISVVSYSISVHETISTEELLNKIHYLEHHPDWIPYRTTYYKEDWGFCCPFNLLSSEKFVGPFEVFIDSSLDNEGELVWTEALHKGSSTKEILISTYACHPSLANDNLSGVITARLFFDYIRKHETKYSYRLIVIPETIGSICFLNNHKNPKDIAAGFVVTTTAGPGKIGVKLGFETDHWINDLTLKVMEAEARGYKTYPFVPDGSDERQYSSPGFRIPTVSITSDKYYEYPEYHTSSDNLQFVSLDRLIEILGIYKSVFHEIESTFIPKRIMDKCEYQLGKRNLFPNTGGALKQSQPEYSGLDGVEIKVEAFSWLMHLADGRHSLRKISEISGLSKEILEKCSKIFLEEGLIKCLSNF